MGNCLTSNKVLAQNDQPDDEQPEVSSQQEVLTEETGQVTASCSKSEDQLKNAVDGVVEKKSKKKKLVRFKLNDDENINADKGESKNGVVRIRLVLTQQELKQILSSRTDENLKQNSSMEQLIRVMKLRGIRIPEAAASDDDGFNGGWRPALESIPEEH